MEDELRFLVRWIKFSFVAVPVLLGLVIVLGLVILL